MVFLLSYDGYMREGKIKEICPTAKLYMKCNLYNCCLKFRRFYETAKPSLEYGDETVPVVVWKIDETDLKDMITLYPNEIYDKTNLNLKVEDDVLQVIVFLMRETEFAFPKERELEEIEEAYDEHKFDYECVENALDMIKDMEGKGYGTLY